MPLFEYDHIEDFARVQEHEASNLALLCSMHHADKTAGRLSRERVRAARLVPFNAQAERSAPYGIAASVRLKIMLGSNQVGVAEPQQEHHVVWINGRSFVTIHPEAGSYSYSAEVTDADGVPLLVIDHGNLVVATDVWDYRYEGRTLTIRRALGEIIFEAEITDELFHVKIGSFVDRFETGLLIKLDGRAVTTMSRLELDTLSEGTFGGNEPYSIAIVRGSCFDGDMPPGGAFLRRWLPEYESQAAELRAKMERGEPGPRKPGLERFRPFPR
jgi:hypothetical protein